MTPVSTVCRRLLFALSLALISHSGFSQIAPDTILQQEPTGELLLITPTVPGKSYTLQSTGTLSPSTVWTSVPRQLYGSGASIALVLVDPVSPSAPPPAQFFHLEPLSDGGTVVSWGNAGFRYRKVISESIAELPLAGAITTPSLDISWRKGSTVTAIDSALNTTIPPAEETKLQELQSALPEMISGPSSGSFLVRLEAPLSSLPPQRQFWRLTQDSPNSDSDPTPDAIEYSSPQNSNPFSEDTDGDLIPDNIENTSGTLPNSSDSDADGTNDNDEANIESESCSKTLPKYGFDSFTATSPPKRYVFKTLIWNPNYIGTVIPFDPDITRPGKNVTFVADTTGASFSYNDDFANYPGTLSYTPLTITGTSQTVRTSAMPWTAPGYDPLLGGPGTLIGAATGTETLTFENTTANVKSKTLSLIPAFTGTFTTTPKTSSHQLSADELSYTATALRYRFRFSGPTTAPRTIHWVESFSPTNPADPAFLALPHDQVHIVRSYTGTAVTTPEETVSAGVRYPTISGTITVARLPIQVVPNPIPVTGTVRAKIVYGPEFTVPEDISGISINVGGEDATNIYQDPTDPNTIYFTPPPAPLQQAGYYDLEVSGIIINGLPSDPITGRFKLENYINYTSDAAQGVEGFSKAIAVGTEEAKAVALYRQAENGLTDSETVELYSALRQWQANPGIEMLQTFLDGKTRTAAVDAALENMVAHNDRQSTSILLALGFTEGGPIAAAASHEEPFETLASLSEPESSSSTITPTLGATDFFTDVKLWMAETGQKVFTGTFGHVNFAVINADDFILDTYTVDAVGKTIEDVKIANPTAEIIVNGALCNLFCDLLERTTKYQPRPAAPLVTTGIVLKEGTYLPTSATPGTASYYTGGLRYWFGQLNDTSPDQNAGAALSYRFGAGHPPVTVGPLGPTNINVAVGGLISLIWQDAYGLPRKKQTVKTDADLGGYDAYTDEVNGFNIVGVDRESGLIIVAGKPDQKRQRLFDDARDDDIQDKLYDSGVDQALITDGGGSAAYYVKGKFDQKGYRHRPPGVLQNLTGGIEYNTVTNYFMFKPRPAN